MDGWSYGLASNPTNCLVPKPNPINPTNTHQKGPAINAVGDTKAWSIGRRMGTTCRGALSSLVMRKAGLV